MLLDTLFFNASGSAMESLPSPRARARARARVVDALPLASLKNRVSNSTRVYVDVKNNYWTSKTITTI